MIQHAWVNAAQRISRSYPSNPKLGELALWDSVCLAIAPGTSYLYSVMGLRDADNVINREYSVAWHLETIVFKRALAAKWPSDQGWVTGY